MLWAIDEFVVEGVRTTLPLQRALLEEPAFHEMKVHTRYVDQWIKHRHSKAD